MLEKALGVPAVSSLPLMSPARIWHIAACIALCNLKPLGSGEQTSSTVTQKLWEGCALAIPDIQRSRGDSAMLQVLTGQITAGD